MAILTIIGGAAANINEIKVYIKDTFPKSDSIKFDKLYQPPRMEKCGFLGGIENTNIKIEDKTYDEVYSQTNGNLVAINKNGATINITMGGEGSYTISDVRIENVEELNPKNVSAYITGGGCGAAADGSISASFNLDKGTVEYYDSMNRYSDKADSKTFLPTSVAEANNVSIYASFETCQKSKKLDLVVEYFDNLNPDKKMTETVEDIEIYNYEKNIPSYSLNGLDSSAQFKKTDGTIFTCSN